MHERKLIRFMTKKIINRSLRKQKKKRKRNQKKKINDDNNIINSNVLTTTQLIDDILNKKVVVVEFLITLKFQNIRDYKIALINFWFYQNSRDINRHSQFNDVFLQTLMKIQKASQH